MAQKMFVHYLELLSVSIIDIPTFQRSRTSKVGLETYTTFASKKLIRLFLLWIFSQRILQLYWKCNQSGS